MRVRAEAPFGGVIVHVEDGQATGLDLTPKRVDPVTPSGAQPVRAAVESYLEGSADRVRVPVDPPKRTDFQQRVDGALVDVDPGEPITYGDLAARLGKPGAARAVGQALRRNPLPLVWPCHRVVAKNGLGGFGGCPPDSDADPLDIKRWLLDHERDALRER